LLTGSERCLVYPENLDALWRSHDLIGGSVPRKGEHVSGLDRKTKPFFAFPEFLLCKPAFRDVLARATESHDAACGISLHFATTDDPSCGAIRAEYL
jgi:hypothetical protein